MSPPEAFDRAVAERATRLGVDLSPYGLLQDGGAIDEAAEHVLAENARMIDSIDLDEETAAERRQRVAQRILEARGRAGDPQSALTDRQIKKKLDAPPAEDVSQAPLDDDDDDCLPSDPARMSDLVAPDENREVDGMSSSGTQKPARQKLTREQELAVIHRFQRHEASAHELGQEFGMSDGWIYGLMTKHEMKRERPPRGPGSAPTSGARRPTARPPRAKLEPVRVTASSAPPASRNGETVDHIQATIEFLREEMRRTQETIDLLEKFQTRAAGRG